MAAPFGPGPFEGQPDGAGLVLSGYDEIVERVRVSREAACLLTGDDGDAIAARYFARTYGAQVIGVAEMIVCNAYAAMDTNGSESYREQGEK